MSSSFKTQNSRYWAEFWEQASRQGKNRGPMLAGFWDNMAGKFARNAPAGRGEERVDSVMKMIEQTGIDVSGAQVLDIGAGTGSLAIPLAKRGATVTAIDFSPEMLKNLNQRARDENLPITTLLKSWDEIDLDGEGFRGAFDLVIASMTPAVRCPDTFRLMHEASRGICYYSGWVHRKWDPAYFELYRMLFQDEFREGMHGFYLPFMYLYMNGYRPDVQISQNVWKSEETIDEMVQSVTGFFSVSREIDDGMKEQIRQYFQSRNTNGKYQSETTAITGMMVWDVRKSS